MVDYLKDFAYCKLTANCTAIDTTLSVDDTSRLPSNSLLSRSDFYLTIESTFTAGLFEIVKVLSKTSSSLTVTRGADDSTAASHSTGDYLKGSLSANQYKRSRATLTGVGYPPGDADLFSAGDRYLDLSTNTRYICLGTSAIDNFSRPDSTTTLGLPWFASPYSGSTPVFGVSGGRGKLYTYPTGQTAAEAKLDTGTTDYDVSVDYYYYDGALVSLVLRSTDQNASDEYYFTLTASGGTTLQTHTGAGSATNATTVATGTSVAALVNGTKYTLRAVVSGSSFTCYVNGVQVISTTNATISTGSFVGIHLRSTNDTFTNFTVASNPRFVYWTNDGSDSLARTTLTQMAVQMDDMLDILQLNDVAIGTHTAQILQSAAAIDDLIDVLVRDESTLDLHSQQLLSIGTAYDDLLDTYQARVPLFQPQGTFLRKYDFNDGTTASWTTDVGSLANVSSRLQLTSATSAGNSSALEPSTASSLSDGELVVTTFPVTADSAGQYDLGVIFRATDANNHYVLVWRQGTAALTSAQFALYKKVSGTYTALATSGGSNSTGSPYSTPLPLGSGSQSRILVRFVGTLIQVYFNDTFVMAHNDSTYTTGLVGVRLANSATTPAAVVQFDDIQAYSLTSTWSPASYA